MRLSGRWLIAGFGAIALSMTWWVGMSEATAQRLPWEPADMVATEILAAAPVEPPIGVATAQPTRAPQHGAMGVGSAPHGMGAAGQMPGDQFSSPAPQERSATSATVIPPKPTVPVADHGTVQEGTIPSILMGGAMPYRIYLPPGYDDPVNATARYPVVYLLHGAPGNYRDWIDNAGADKTADALITTGRIPPLILVMPEGTCDLLRDSEWSDGTPPALQAESYLVREVVPFIDVHYRTLADRDHRAVGGLSTGAYARVNSTFHHPDVFSIGWSLSGNYSAAKTILGQPVFRTATSVALNTPLTYVARLADPQHIRIYLDTGKQDNLDNTNVETREMERALVAAGVPHLVNCFDGGHTRRYWGRHLVDALTYVAANLPTPRD